MILIEFLQAFIFKLNSIITAKKYTHRLGAIFLTVAEPEDFLASKHKGYDPLTMICLQGYLQSDNGKWLKVGLFRFHSVQEVVESGVVQL